MSTAATARAIEPGDDITLAMAQDALAVAGNVLPFRARAEAAWRALRVRDRMPIRAIDHRWDATVRDCYGQDPAHQVLVLLKAEQWFKTFGERGDISRLWFDENTAAVHAAAAGAGAQLASMGLTFNAHAFISSMRGRGMVVAVDAAGRIAVTPSSMLNPNDRQILHTHKPAILAALKEKETF